MTDERGGVMDKRTEELLAELDMAFQDREQALGAEWDSHSKDEKLREFYYQAQEQARTAHAEIRRRIEQGSRSSKVEQGPYKAEVPGSTPGGTISKQVEGAVVSRERIRKALAWTIGAGTRATADRAEEEIVVMLRKAGVKVEE